MGEMGNSNLYVMNELNTNEKSIKKLFLNIKQEYLKSNKTELVIVNIGTDKCIGDALAPIVGKLSKDKLKAIKMYGTIQNPIHAINLDKEYQKIVAKHKDAFILGIDASISDKHSKGTIILRNTSVKPGKGVGKNLQEVGNISLIGVVDRDGFGMISNNSIRLAEIWDMAEKINSVVVKLDKSLYRMKNNKRVVSKS